MSLGHRFFSALGAAALLLTAGTVTGQVYKSVDEKGRVIYSDRPVPDAVSTEPVEIEEGPTEEQVREAEERAGQAVSRSREMDAERAAQQEARRKEEAAAKPKPVEQVESDGSGGWYPAYPRVGPPSRPTVPKGPGTGGDHPAYNPDRPPARPRPPIARPLPGG
jgi:hypothetical protein